MYSCWQCKVEYEDDVNSCPKCGAIRPIDDDPDSTLVVKQSAHAQLSRQSVAKNKVLLTTELSLNIGGKTLVVPAGKRVIFGRGVKSSNDLVAVDLSPFNGTKLGVSRNHADLRRIGTSNLILIDLGSTNGTRVNGEILTPFKAYKLDHNDQIFLGHLELTIQLVVVALPAASTS